MLPAYPSPCMAHTIQPAEQWPIVKDISCQRLYKKQSASGIWETYKFLQDVV